MSTAELFWILVPAVGTAVGGVAILVVGGAVSDRLLDGLMGFTAGVMLAATAFSLLVPALDSGPLWQVLAAFVAGGLALMALDALVPHAHERFFERGHAPPAGRASQRAALLLAALVIHNVPEGAAVGTALAAGGTGLGVPFAAASALQNVPEGFAAAAPLLATDLPRSRVALVGVATGLVEPPAALLAFWALSLSEVLLPIGLAFAAAAMLYVVVDELLPECYVRGNERLATLAFLAGFVLMMGLDAGLG